METRRFYLQLSSGEQFEISELDFNNIEDRIGTGRTNGWYMQRGELDPNTKGLTRHDWKVSFSDIGSVFANRPANVDRVIRDKFIDVTKRKRPEVGKIEVKPNTKCGHDWNKREDYEFVTTIAGGVNRYYKQCNECSGKSTLIKKREVEVAMEKNELTLNDVPLIEAK